MKKIKLIRPADRKRRPKKPKTLDAFLLLDRTGSMFSVRDKTISGFNEYVNGLRVASDIHGIPTTLTLVQFDSQGIDTVLDLRPIGLVPALTRETYIPRASTNLYDAIGKTLHDMLSVLSNNLSLAILTDGQENASREFTKSTIKAKIETAIAKGWLISYLGANQDAWAEGGAIGINTGNTMTFNQAFTQNAFVAQAESTMRYANHGGGVGGQLAANYTAAERQSAGEPPRKKL